MTFQNHKGNSVSDVNLPYYQLDVLSHATDDFSEDKKLGHGGSGIVYKVFFFIFHNIMSIKMYMFDV